MPRAAELHSGSPCIYGGSPCSDFSGIWGFSCQLRSCVRALSCDHRRARSCNIELASWRQSLEDTVLLAAEITPRCQLQTRLCTALGHGKRHLDLQRRPHACSSDTAKYVHSVCARYARWKRADRNPESKRGHWTGLTFAPCSRSRSTISDPLVFGRPKRGLQLVRCLP
jgi:hypothetical protein